MQEGAITIRFKDDAEDSYIVLPINEFRSGGPVFQLHDAGMRGSHLLSADDVRANWDAWVRDLVRADQIFTSGELAQQYPDITTY